MDKYAPISAQGIYSSSTAMGDTYVEILTMSGIKVNDVHYGLSFVSDD